MSEEDINFLISIQDLEQPEFDNACLERENERLRKELQQKENIIKEVRETLNNKRSILTTQLLNGEYCDYEELLYQVDEEIRKILDKENK